MKKLFFVVLINGLIYSQSHAQRPELGLSAGLSFYNGDLSPADASQYLDFAHPAYGIFGKLHVSNHFAIRISGNYGHLSGDDAFSNVPERGLSFKTAFLEGYLAAEWTVFRLFIAKGSLITGPYIFAGAGGYRFNPRRQINDEWVSLQPYGTEGQGLPGYGEPYNLNQLALPFGGGWKFVIRDRIVIGAEVGARFLFTDYIDDVSGMPVVYNDFIENNRLASAFLSRPNFNRSKDDPSLAFSRGRDPQDWYYLGNINLSILLGNNRFSKNPKTDCPTF